MSGAVGSDFSRFGLFSASPFELFSASPLDGLSACAAADLSSSCQLGIEIGLIGGFVGNLDLVDKCVQYEVRHLVGSEDNPLPQSEYWQKYSQSCKTHLSFNANSLLTK